MTKFTFQALAMTGILAVSGLPAFAADMTPASPPPSASVSSDSHAKLGSGTGAAIGTTGKSSADMSIDKSKAAAEKKAGTAKSATEKKTDKAAKDAKTQMKQQTAQRPAPSAGPSGSVGVNGSVGGNNANGSVGATGH
jgi:hypothetical protein